MKLKPILIFGFIIIRQLKLTAMDFETDGNGF